MKRPCENNPIFDIVRGEPVTPARVGQVRLDVKGKLAVIVAESIDGLALQISEHTVQGVPLEYREVFERTTFCLGEL